MLHQLFCCSIRNELPGIPYRWRSESILFFDFLVFAKSSQGSNFGKISYKLKASASSLTKTYHRLPAMY